MCADADKFLVTVFHSFKISEMNKNQDAYLNSFKELFAYAKVFLKPFMVRMQLKLDHCMMQWKKKVYISNLTISILLP